MGLGMEGQTGFQTRQAGSCQLRHTARPRSPAVMATQATSGIHSLVWIWRSATSDQPPAKAHSA